MWLKSLKEINGARHMKRMCAIFFIFVFIVCILSSCGTAATEVKKQIFAMDTQMTLALYGDNASNAAEDAVKSINRANALWSKEIPSSEIYALNNAGAGRKARLSESTYDILQKALQFAEETGGAFDPSIGPVSEAWDIQNKKTVLSDDEIAKLLPLVGYKNIVLEEGCAYFRKNGMKADLGAIGKGYISDIVTDIFKSNNIKTAIFSLGGNVGVMGLKKDGSKYKVGIRDPEGTANDYIGYVTLTDSFIVSSGDYERFFIRDGVRYHHIFDPKTGKPAGTGLREVTVIAGNGAMADAYSTAFFVTGLDRAMEFYDKKGGFEAIFITDDKRIIATGGLRDIFTFTAADRGYKYEN